MTPRRRREQPWQVDLANGQADDRPIALGEGDVASVACEESRQPQEHLFPAWHGKRSAERQIISGLVDHGGDRFEIALRCRASSGAYPTLGSPPFDMCAPASGKTTPESDFSRPE